MADGNWRDSCRAGGDTGENPIWASLETPGYTPRIPSGRGRGHPVGYAQEEEYMPQVTVIPSTSAAINQSAVGPTGSEPRENRRVLFASSSVGTSRSESPSLLGPVIERSTDLLIGDLLEMNRRIGNTLANTVDRQDRMSSTYTEALVEAVEQLKVVAEGAINRPVVREPTEAREKRVEALALAQIPVYSGQGVDAVEWIEVLEEVAESNGWSLDQRRQVAMAKLENSARDWHMGEGRDHRRWVDWKAEFLLAFGRPRSFYDWTTKLHERTRMPTETLLEYCYAKKRLLRMGPQGVQMSDQDQIRCLLKGIGEREVETMILATKPRTLQEVINSIRSHELHYGTTVAPVPTPSISRPNALTLQPQPVNATTPGADVSVGTPPIVRVERTITRLADLLAKSEQRQERMEKQMALMQLSSTPATQPPPTYTSSRPPPTFYNTSTFQTPSSSFQTPSSSFQTPNSTYQTPQGVVTGANAWQVGNRTCFTCGREGHISRECDQQRGRRNSGSGVVRRLSESENE